MSEEFPECPGSVKGFEKIAKKVLDHCWDVLVVKGAEYSRDDNRLYNFDSAARKRNNHPIEALLGMKVKHDVSVDDLCAASIEGRYLKEEVVLEKIGDSINYLLLLAAMLMRENAKLGDNQQEGKAAFTTPGDDLSDSFFFALKNSIMSDRRVISDRELMKMNPEPPAIPRKVSIKTSTLGPMTEKKQP